MKIVPVKEKKAIHTRVDTRVFAKVSALATKHDLDKCDVINSLLTLGIAAHERHVKKARRARNRR